jgi:hypothetical protein
MPSPPHRRPKRPRQAQRITLALDRPLLDRVRRELGAKSYSATVNLALKELLRLRKVQSLSEFHGSRAWSGELSEMREDKQ